MLELIRKPGHSRKDLLGAAKKPPVQSSIRPIDCWTKLEYSYMDLMLSFDRLPPLMAAIIRDSFTCIPRAALRWMDPEKDGSCGHISSSCIA